jgi:hypothetical protein
MRILVLATVLLASSSLYPSIAQDEGKAPAAAPQTAPAQNQNAPAQQDQRTGSDQKTDNREVGRDWRMRPSEGERMSRDDREGRDDRMGRDDREMGHDWRMHRDRDMGRERYGERGDRDWDRADRDLDNRGYYDQDRPRRRVKVCVEYENGDEYCHYRN